MIQDRILLSKVLDDDGNASAYDKDKQRRMEDLYQFYLKGVIELAQLLYYSFLDEDFIVSDYPEVVTTLNLLQIGIMNVAAADVARLKIQNR